MSDKVRIQPHGDRWGRFPYFYAKIGTGPGTLVIVKRARSFRVGMKITYCEYTQLQGVSFGCTPKWATGTVWKIDGNRLFIVR